MCVGKGGGAKHLFIQKVHLDFVKKNMQGKYINRQLEMTPKNACKTAILRCLSSWSCMHAVWCSHHTYTIFTGFPLYFSLPEYFHARTFSTGFNLVILKFGRRLIVREAEVQKDMFTYHIEGQFHFALKLSVTCLI